LSFYSQNGEDFLISRLFEGQARGRFVEVGCIDGRRFANSLSLEEQGWEGLCIEAHPGYMDLLRANRPGSRVVHCAIGDRDQAEVTFYANRRGSLSTLKPEMEPHFREHYAPYFSGFEPCSVPLRTLSSVLDEYGVTDVDVLSLDIEGAELDALRGIDFSRHRPRLLVVECLTPQEVLAVEAILLPAGYMPGFRVSSNYFYTTEPELLEHVRGGPFAVELIHTRHPLDEGGDVHVSAGVAATPVDTGESLETLLQHCAAFDPGAGDVGQWQEVEAALLRRLARGSAATLATGTSAWQDYARGLAAQLGGEHAQALEHFARARQALGDDWRVMYRQALAADATRNAANMALAEQLHWHIQERRPDFEPSQRFFAEQTARYAFHGDPQYQAMMGALLACPGVSAFVETGTFLGRSTAFAAGANPEVPVFTAEISAEYFDLARRRLQAFPNVSQYHMHSADFMRLLVAEEKAVGDFPVFFLDAHWYDDWPLVRELELIRNHCPRAIVVIDDFQVPGQPQFPYDNYGREKVCGLDAVAGHLPDSAHHHNLFPRYSRDAVPDYITWAGYAVFFIGAEDAYERVAGLQRLQPFFFSHDVDAQRRPAPATPAYRFTNDWFDSHEPHWQQRFLPWAGTKESLNILEIGSYEGRSACWFLDNLMQHPASRLTCVDPWISRDGTHRWASDMDEVYQRFLGNIAASGKGDQVSVRRGDFQAIADQLPERSFDLVYVDGDHAEDVVYADTLSAYRLVRDGGLIVWDDYFWSANDSVKRGVDRACAELGIQPERFGNQLLFEKPCKDRAELAGADAGAAAEEDIVAATADMDFPFLVSFPRTGSHWLRMALERYFDRPLLTRSFFDHAGRDDYLLLHSHDMDMNLVRRNVLYLHRDPVDTVFSQLNYHGEDCFVEERVAYWADLYGQHVHKWLDAEDFTRRKCVLSYEAMRDDPAAELARAIEHLGGTVDAERIGAVLAGLDKGAVKERTGHDPRVVADKQDYAQQRAAFRERMGEAVWSRFLCGRPALANRFDRPPVAAPADDAPATHPRQPWEYKKIVGLLAGKNEAPRLEFCLRALAAYCDSIVYFDDNSEDDSVAIVEALARECRVEGVIRKTDDRFQENIRREVPFSVGRQLGGTHFVVIDADEAFTANCLDGDFLRRRILSMAPGESLEVPWIQLWRSVTKYRDDESSWSKESKAIAFADDGNCAYEEKFIHLQRVPSGLTGKRHRLDGRDRGLLHFQFVNWRNLLVKQAWYRCLERVNDPAKPAEDINALYAPSKDESGLGLAEAPYAWFCRYPFIDVTRFDAAETWRERQVMAWFDEYGPAHFQDLDIWDVEWGTGLGREPVAVPASVRDDDADRCVAQAEQRYEAGDMEGARDLLARALELDPYHLDAINDLGVMLWATGDAVGAAALFTRVLNIEPAARSALINAVRALQAAGRPMDAWDLLHDLKAHHPDDEEVAALVTVLETERQGAHHATETREEGMSAEAVNLNARAEELAEAGRLGEAKACLLRALAYAPDDVEVLNNLGAVCWAEGDEQGALEALSRALSMAPEHEAASANLRAIAESMASREPENPLSEGEDAQDFDRCWELLREPKRKDANLHSEGSVDRIAERLRALGIEVRDFSVDVADYERYFSDAAYLDTCPDYYSFNRKEKSLEHYLATVFLKLNSSDVYVDVACEHSPVADIYGRLFGLTAYRQDLSFEPGLIGDRIGGSAADMPVVDEFATKMALHCSFEHFEGDADTGFIREANRVLRAGGAVCIAPLYMAEEYGVMTDPVVAVEEGVPFEEDATLFCSRGWANRHGRVYDPEHLFARVYQHLGGMKMTVYRITNASEVDPSCYIQFAAVIEKPAADKRADIPVQHAEGLETSAREAVISSFTPGSRPSGGATVSARKPLFLTGCPRSGTTALWEILAADARLGIGVERFGRRIMDEFSLAPRLLEPARFFDLHPEDAFYSDLDGFHPYYGALRERYAHCEYVGDKLPLLYTRLAEFRQAFGADAKLLFLFRNIFDVAASYKARAENPDDTLWLPEQGVEAAVEDWNASIAAALNACDGLSVHFVSYERLLQAGEGLDELYRFLELEPNAQAVERHQALLLGSAGLEAKRQRDLGWQDVLHISANASFEGYRRVLPLCGYGGDGIADEVHGTQHFVAGAAAAPGRVGLGRG